MAELLKAQKEAARLMDTVQEQLDVDIQSNSHSSCRESETQPSQVYEEQLATTEDEADHGQQQQEEQQQQEQQQEAEEVRSGKGKARTRKRGRGRQPQVDEEATEETEQGTQEEGNRRR
jgi:hypothetical protein